MSTAGTMPLTVPPLALVDVRRNRQRLAGTILAAAETAEPASFELAGGRAAVFTSRAPQKLSVNEDAAALWPIGPDRGVLAVADGLGGHAGGERASRLAIEALGRALQAALAQAEASHSAERLRGAILNGIEAANQAVRDLGTGAATTLALADIHGRTVRPYHVGDSAILLTGQRGKIKLQTISHSPIGYAIEAGLMEEVDAIHHDARHVISNVIGSEEMRIEIGPLVEMAPRDTLVLASDGLLDNLLLNEIVDLVRSGPLDRAVGGLVEKARARMTGLSGEGPSKPDDLTVIAYRPI